MHATTWMKSQKRYARERSWTQTTVLFHVYKILEKKAKLVTEADMWLPETRGGEREVRTNWGRRAFSG